MAQRHSLLPQDFPALRAVSGRVPSAPVYELLDRLVHAGVEPPAITAARHGHQMPDPDLAIVSILSSTLGEAFATTAEARALLQDDFDWLIEREGRKAYLRVVPCGEPGPGSEELASMVLVLGASAMRAVSGTPIDVRGNLRSRPHPGYEKYASRLSYGGSETLIYVDADVLDAKLHSSCDALAERFRTLVRRRVARVGEAPETTDQVLELFRSAPGGFGEPVDSIARPLSLSSRTLQRRLSEEGTSLEELRDLAGCQLALPRLLREPVESIARALGYSDERSFRRAFTRWTGSSPSEMRGRLMRSRAYAW